MSVGPGSMRLRPPNGPTRTVLGVPVVDGPAPAPWAAAVATDRLCFDAQRLRMRDGPCVLYVAGGDTVVLDAPDDATRLMYDFLAYATASRVLLWQRQRFNLHATLLVDPQDRCVAITGHSNSGKSTTTVELVRRGWRFACDDVVEVDLAGGVARAIPFDRPIHLSDEAVALLGADPGAGRALPWREKKVYAATADLTPRPLHALIHLALRDGGDQPRITPKPGLTGLPLLAHLSDQASLCQLPEHRDPYLTWCLGLARAVPLLEVSRPAGVQTIKAVADAVEQCLAVVTGTSESA